MDLDLESLSLTEIIRLQNRLSEALRRRFTRTLAISFTDIVGSTAYFARFGDEAGRRLQQRHFDLLERALLPRKGRIVDTAGDGALSCFDAVEAGALALTDFFNLLRDDNAAHPHDERLEVRASLHWGEVLADAETVSGEAVNLASRVGQTGGAGEIRITRDAFRELPNALKLRAERVAPVTLKGVPGVVETLVLGWEDRSLYPVAVRIAETGEERPLPQQDSISFGRLDDNDVVLRATDAEGTQTISRFHFELRRKAGGFVLRSHSARATEVDGKSVGQGEEARVRPGSVVRVGRALTLTFTAPSGDDAGLTTLL